jgi:hypothetical protein
LRPSDVIHEEQLEGALDQYTGEQKEEEGFAESPEYKEVSEGGAAVSDIGKSQGQKEEAGQIKDESTLEKIEEAIISTYEAAKDIIGGTLASVLPSVSSAENKESQELPIKKESKEKNLEGRREESQKDISKESEVAAESTFGKI